MSSNSKDDKEDKNRDQGRGSHEGSGSHEGRGSHGKDSKDDRSGHGTSNRGFASMDEDKQREIASKGGHAAHEKGTAHEFNSEEAREAGHKGGEAVSQDREHMSEIGRKGGETVSQDRRTYV